MAVLFLFSHQVMSDSFVIPWTVAHQAPLSMRLPRQDYWSGLPFPSPGHLPDPGIKPMSPALAGGLFTTEPPGKPDGTIPLAYSKTIKETGELCEKEMRRRIMQKVGQGQGLGRPSGSF